MIEIRRADGEIRIEGHAGYAPPGQDIVCAAISTLTQVFLASVGRYTTDNIQSEIKAGFALIRYGSLSREAQLLTDSFFYGCEMIAAAYPAYVRIVQAVKTEKAAGRAGVEPLKATENRTVSKIGGKV